MGRVSLGERFGSGDGERKTLLTRQIAFEPLPASVLFALGGSVWFRVKECCGLISDQLSIVIPSTSPASSKRTLIT
jgi:hypothetical protein